MARGGPAPRTESCCSASRSRRGGAEKICPRSRPPLRSRGRCPRAQTVEHDVLMRSLLLASLRGGLALCARENPLLGAASARQNRARSAPRPRVRTPFASVISPRAPSRTRPAGWTPRRACTKAGRRACSGWMGRPRSSTTARWDTRGSRARRVRAADLGARARARLRRSRPPPSSLPRRPTTSRRPRQRSSRCVPGRTIAPRAGCVFARRKAVERPRFFEPRATPPPPSAMRPRPGRAVPAAAPGFFRPRPPRSSPRLPSTRRRALRLAPPPPPPPSRLHASNLTNDHTDADVRLLSPSRIFSSFPPSRASPSSRSTSASRSRRRRTTIASAPRRNTSRPSWTRFAPAPRSPT